MCLEYLQILELLWNVYRVYWNVFGISPENTGTCLEFLSGILECDWNMYREYGNVSGMSTGCTGINLEHLQSNWNFVEYVVSILE